MLVEPIVLKGILLIQVKSIRSHKMFSSKLSVISMIVSLSVKNDSDFVKWIVVLAAILKLQPLLLF